MPRKDDINPATGRQYAVNPATGVWDDTYWAEVVEPMLKNSFGGGESASEKTARVLRENTEKAYNEFFGKLKEFDEKNPFAFDEALATRAARETVDPFYRQQLDNFLRGVERKKTRGIEDAQELVGELAVGGRELGGRVKRNLDLAIEKSQEGYAGFGSAQSGRAQRAEGLLRVGAGEKAQDTMTELTRLFEDIQEQKRLTGQETGTIGVGGEFVQGRAPLAETFSSVAAARARENAKRELGRFEFASEPLRQAGVNPLDLFTTRNQLVTQVGQLPGV